MRFLGKLVKFIGNFIGVILSLVLSLALLVMLVATPMLSGLSAFTRPETIRQVVQDVDFAAILRESFRGEMSEEERQQMELVVGLTETQAFGDLVELYATDLSNAFEGESKPSVLTKEALRKIANNNMDELIDIVRQMGETMGEDLSSYTDAEMEEKVWENFEEMADKFLEMAPTADDLRKLMAKISEEISTDSSTDNERPNSGVEFVEDSYDTPSDEWEEGSGTITYLPGEGGTITNVIINSDSTIDTENGSFTYIVDENGNVIIQSGEGGGMTAVGGKITFGKAVAIQNRTIRVFGMSLGSSGGEQPEKEQQEDIAEEIMQLAKMAKNGTLTLAFVGVMVVFALLICLFRWPRFKGLMWVAVMLLIGAVFVALAGVAYIYLPGMIAGNSGAKMSVLSAVKPVIMIIANSMFVAAAIYAGVAIVLIVLFVLLRKALRKQKAAKAAAAARPEAVEEVAQEAEGAAEMYEEAAVAELAEVEGTPAQTEEIPEEISEEAPVEAEIPAEEVAAEEISAE